MYLEQDEQEIEQLIHNPIRFATGLPDWEDELLYELMPSKLGYPLWTLQSCADSLHELVLIQPHWLMPNYLLETDLNDQASRIFASKDELIPFVPLTILSDAPNEYKVRAHLLTPLFIHSIQKSGHRFLLNQFPINYSKSNRFKLTWDPTYSSKRIE